VYAFPSITGELQQVLPEGTRMIDSGAAIARRTAWLLEHEAPDAKSVMPILRTVWR
jgi:glutamate racemase